MADAGDKDTRSAGEESPYRGLASFTRADAGLFFGRERQVEAFVNRLRAHALLAVVGPSGAGKENSFVQAGVLPALPEGEGWHVVTIRPGPAPMATLTRALEAIHLTTATLPRERILLVIDQFEELLTLCQDPDERRQFAEAIVQMSRNPDDPARVIITLRDDFLVRIEQLPALRDRLARGLQILSTPAPEDLLRILVEPAHRSGYEFDDPDLPSRMVQAVADQPGALALLSFTAARLFALRDRHFKQLPRKAYDSMGGVGGALAQHAEETLGNMTAEEQKLVREAFRHLVTAEGTRAVMPRTELRHVLGASASADSVIEKLVNARLLTASEEDRIEVIHEALLSAWPRLVTWRRDDAEGSRLRDQVRAAARQWDDRRRPRGLLWRAEALEEYRLWRARYPGTLTEVEDAFGTASIRDASRGRRTRNVLQLAPRSASPHGRHDHRHPAATRPRRSERGRRSQAND